MFVPNLLSVYTPYAEGSVGGGVALCSRQVVPGGEITDTQDLELV